MRRFALFGLALPVAVACIALGIWQLRRLASRRAANEQALTIRGLPVLLMANGTGTGLVANRRARLNGNYDENREFLLRGRVIQGVPAVQVVTPLRMPGSDTAVLVNRGYVPAPDAMDPGTAIWAEPGPQDLQGVLLAVPDRGDGNPMRRAGRETWQRLDLQAMRARLPYPIAALYLIAEADPAAGDAHTLRGRVYPFRDEPPRLGEGPHLMYALQWFGIAAAVLAFAVIFVLRRGPQNSVNSQQ